MGNKEIHLEELGNLRKKLERGMVIIKLNPLYQQQGSEIIREVPLGRKQRERREERVKELERVLG